VHVDISTCNVSLYITATLTRASFRVGQIYCVCLCVLVPVRGAVAADGRIEPGDMLLEVNEVNFENMTNDDAVRTLRDIVQTPG